MVNFGTGKIYKLSSDVDDKFYVGSTTNPLFARKGGHVLTSAKHPDYPHYAHFNNIGWKNVKISLIEDYPCTSKEELLAREKHWIDELQPQLNSPLPVISDEERNQKLNLSKKNWRDKNKDYYKEYNAKYKQEHPDKVVERYQKSKESFECQCGGHYLRKYKSCHEKTDKHQNFLNHFTGLKDL